MTISKKCISDAELVALIRHDKKAGYNMLYKVYAPLLYGFILRTKKEPVASDILVRSFTEIWKTLNLYEPSKSSLFIWMMNITQGCLDKTVDSAHNLQKVGRGFLKLAPL